MKITKNIYTKLLNCPRVPPECGGIIGSKHGDIITHVVLDKGCLSDAGIMYIPNTQFLNQTIAEWEKSGIKFRGIFHTHAPQWTELSNEDRVYIIDILKAMPASIKFLYFPLVFPGIQIKNYITQKTGNAFDIVDDDIEIIGKEEESQNEKNK